MSARSRNPATKRTLAAASAVVLLSLLSLLSFLDAFGPAQRSVVRLASAAACDSGERPALDTHVDAAQSAVLRPVRGSEPSAPRVRAVEAPAHHALGIAARPRAISEDLLAQRRSFVDASIPRARARAEGMVFLI